MTVSRGTIELLRVVGFLASRLNPVDRLECGHIVPCTRNGTTEPHSERCAECEQ